MDSLAARRRRRRQIATTAGFVVLFAVLAVVGTLWRRSVQETYRAEASKLVALAQVQLSSDPTEALAFTTASLELADTVAARSFVMKALWEAPPAVILETDDSGIHFSPSGRWAISIGLTNVATVWSNEGEGPIELHGLERNTRCRNVAQWASESLVVTGLHPSCMIAERVRLWSIPDGELVRTIEFGAATWWQVDSHRLFTETPSVDPGERGLIQLRSWQLPGGKPEHLGWIDSKALGGVWSRFDPTGTAWLYSKGHTIFSRPLPIVEGNQDRVVGAHDVGRVGLLHDASRGDRLVSRDAEGEIRVWALSTPGIEPQQVIPRPESASPPYILFPDPEGRWVYRAFASQIGKGLLWDLSTSPDAQPLELRRNGSWMFSNSDFHPTSDWLAVTVAGSTEAAFWPLRSSHQTIVKGATTSRKGLAFSPDSRLLAATWPPGRARIIPLPNIDQREAPALAEHSALSTLVFNPTGTRLTGGHYGHGLSVVPLDGSEPQRLEGFLDNSLIESTAFSPSGGLVAAASGIGYDEKMLRVWNLNDGKTQAFELPDSGRDTSDEVDLGYIDLVQNLWFTDETTLFTVGASGFLRWDLRDGSKDEVIALDAVNYRTAAASADGQRVLIIDTSDGHEGNICDTPMLYDLASRTADALPALGDCVRVIALDPGGNVAVTGDAHGVVRVGRVAGGESHLLTGHEGAIEYVAISPDLQWVASVGSDSTLRLWPMPDLDKPPLHTLPHDELIAKLHSLTNLRAVRDDESATGWKVEIGPFPGWAEVPEW